MLGQEVTSAEGFHDDRTIVPFGQRGILDALDAYEEGLSHGNEGFARTQANISYHRDSTLLAIDERNMLQGMIQYEVASATRVLSLEGLYVDPKQKGKGVERALIHKVLKHAGIGSGVRQIGFTCLGGPDKGDVFRDLCAPHRVEQHGAARPLELNNRSLPQTKFAVDIVDEGDVLSSLPEGWRFAHIGHRFDFPGTDHRMNGMAAHIWDKHGNGNYACEVRGSAFGHQLCLNYSPARGESRLVLLDDVGSVDSIHRITGSDAGLPEELREKLRTYLPPSRGHNVSELLEFFEPEVRS